jgi:MFS family permease
VRRLLVLVGAIVFVDTMFFAALTPLLPHYAHEFGIGKTGWGLLQAAYPAGALVGAVPSGIVAARLGVKPTVIAGLVCIAVTSTAFGFADSLWQLDLARFAQGLASSFSWTGGLAWLVAAAPPGRRGALIGTAFGLAIGGALFGPVLGGVASFVGTGDAFTAVAVLALGQAVWAWRTPAATPDEPQPVSTLFAAMRTRHVRAGIWFVMLPALLFGTLSVLAPVRLYDLGFGAVAIGATWLTSAAFEAVSRRSSATSPTGSGACGRSWAASRRLRSSCSCCRGPRTAGCWRSSSSAPGSRSGRSGRRRCRCSPTRPRSSGSTTATRSRSSTSRGRRGRRRAPG